MPNEITTDQAHAAQFAVDGAVHALDRVAQKLEEDAARVRDFIAAIREQDAAEYVDSALDANVTDLTMRVLNTSSIVAPIRSAITNAQRAVQGR